MIERPKHLGAYSVLASIAGFLLMLFAILAVSIGGLPKLPWMALLFTSGLQITVVGLIGVIVNSIWQWLSE